MNDNCLFCDYPCCDICPFGERDYDDFKDLQPEMYSELKNQDIIAGDVYE